MNINTILGQFINIGMVGLAVILLLIVLGFLFIIKNGGLGSDKEAKAGKKQYIYGVKKFFMTRSENDFYHGLVQAVGNEYVIFAQVHLPTIVDEKLPGQDWRAARARIDRKSVDFVLCDKEYLNPRLAIELDDISHERPDRHERDGFVEEILKQAGLPLLRIQNSENLSTSELAQRIKEKI